MRGRGRRQRRLRAVPKTDREISRPSCVPIDRARERNSPLPTTCSASEGSGLGALRAAFSASLASASACFSASAAAAAASAAASAAACSALIFSYADSRSTGCA